MNRRAFYLTAGLLALLPFHAFLFTWFQSFFWGQEWLIAVQAWKEMAVLLLAVFAGWRVLAGKADLNILLRSPANLFAIALLVLGAVYLAIGDSELMQRVLGYRTLAVWLVLFLAVQCLGFTSAQIKRLFRIALGSGALVIALALVQHFFLPADILKYVGYSENVSSWLPGGNLPMYHLVGATDLIRLQATFAGPNQFAAYLLIIITLAAEAFFKSTKHRARYWLALLMLGGVTALVFTYSRSAWLGLYGIALYFVVLYTWREYKHVGLVVLAGIIIAKITLSFVAMYYMPDLYESIVRQASSAAHLERTLTSMHVVAAEPLGYGLGESAGISQRFDTEHVGITPENTYLGIALELGWLGGLLFVGFIVSLLTQLRRVHEPLFFSVLGIAVVMLFLHPLEDMPTALTLATLIGCCYSQLEKNAPTA